LYIFLQPGPYLAALAFLASSVSSPTSWSALASISSCVAPDSRSALSSSALSLPRTSAINARHAPLSLVAASVFCSPVVAS